MEMFNYWFLLALILLAMEMATGTFYLLVLSIAMALAGLAAMFAVGMAWQLTLCALTVISGTMILRLWKGVRGNEEGNSLDVGQQVEVLTWFDNGFARVAYRGAEWDAEPESADVSRNGIFYIKEMRGSSLILTHRKP
ncbi:MAG: NfeD family protein [Proteobacteria bacterium]|nr:NfeD family protein [Pseudomonadota bacterium]